MKVQENKKVAKQVKKLPAKIQQKYKELFKSLMSDGLQVGYNIEKLRYTKDHMRIKLDYSHRVGIYVKNNMIEVVTVCTRENFNYV